MTAPTQVLLTFSLDFWDDGQFRLSFKDRTNPHLWGNYYSGMSLEEAAKKIKDTVENHQGRELKPIPVNGIPLGATPPSIASDASLPL